METFVILGLQEFSDRFYDSVSVTSRWKGLRIQVYFKVLSLTIITAKGFNENSMIFKEYDYNNVEFDSVFESWIRRYYNQEYFKVYEYYRRTQITDLPSRSRWEGIIINQLFNIN